MKDIAIVDPYPRTMELIFSKPKLIELKNKFKLIFAPKTNKQKFYINNIHKAKFIIGQPDLPKFLLMKAKKLKAVINVESNFLDNMDYNYCFDKGIHVIATSPVFSKPVAEIALGFTLSLLRNIHGANQDFINKKEKYGLDGNLKSSLLSDKRIGLLGFGDLGKALVPLLKPFSSKINIYDPWIPNKKIINQGFKPITLKKMFKECEVIYVLAAITTKNKGLIDKKLLNLMKSNSLFILMSRAAVVNFKDLKNREKYLISNNPEINGENFETLEKKIPKDNSGRVKHNFSPMHRFDYIKNDSNQTIIMLGTKLAREEVMNICLLRFWSHIYLME